MLNLGERLKLVALVEDSVFDSIVSFPNSQLLISNTSDIRVKLCTLFLVSATSRSLLKASEVQDDRQGIQSEELEILMILLRARQCLENMLGLEGHLVEAGAYAL